MPFEHLKTRGSWDGPRHSNVIELFWSLPLQVPFSGGDFTSAAPIIHRHTSSPSHG